MAPSPLELISEELDWREAELGSLKILLARDDTTEHQKLVLLRACWALLYAHYEGFVKTALTIFFDRARNQASDCGSLPELTRAFALEGELKKVRNLPSVDLVAQIGSFSETHLSGKPVFPEIDTKSNLWPTVLEELLGVADIGLPALDVHRAKLNTLVRRRNGIAHGDSEIIPEILYYREFESAVYDVMYQLAFGVDERLSRSPYV